MVDARVECDSSFYRPFSPIRSRTNWTKLAKCAMVLVGNRPIFPQITLRAPHLLYQVQGAKASRCKWSYARVVVLCSPRCSVPLACSITLAHNSCSYLTLLQLIFACSACFASVVPFACRVLCMGSSPLAGCRSTIQLFFLCNAMEHNKEFTFILVCASTMHRAYV